LREKREVERKIGREREREREIERERERRKIVRGKGKDTKEQWSSTGVPRAARCPRKIQKMKEDYFL